MKKNFVLIVCILLVSLFVSEFILATGNQLDINEDQKSAFIIWGTRDYSDENYMGGEPELAASKEVCSYIYNFLADSKQFDYCENYWGSGTQPNQVYSNVSYCEEYYDFTAVFYKGHSIDAYCDCENCSLGKHWTIYADKGYDEEYIMDYKIHEMLSSGTHDFVFLWTCGYGTASRIGEIDENGHSVGMLASWMNTTHLEPDGYMTPDSTKECLIGFDNYSIWFTNTTGYGNFNYGDFASLFFEYTMIDGWTINDALDAATEETHTQASFGDCQLYTGYLMPDVENNGQPVTSYMRVWGDGNLTLKQNELSSLQITDNSKTEKVFQFLEYVVGLDVSKYDKELLGTSLMYPDWLDGLPLQAGKIVIESETSKLDVLFKLRNDTLTWCLVRPTEGKSDYSENVTLDNFLKKYKSYSQDLGININKDLEKDFVASFRNGQFYAFSDKSSTKRFR
jgi:hypothetical protein